MRYCRNKNKCLDLRLNLDTMIPPKLYDAIIVGGSYAGLSAAMALGRSMRQVLIIDSGMPCNIQTPESHNFITHDGTPPHEIAASAREQVLKYPTIQFLPGLATAATQTPQGFAVTTWDGDIFRSRKLLLATGVKDILPDIEGADSCWGISLLHCPYCHGYEYKGRRTGILSNGDTAFEMARLLSNWTQSLTIFTNGPSQLSGSQYEVLQSKNIHVEQKPISQIAHNSGQLHSVVLLDASPIAMDVMYTRPAFVQHSNLAADLGCRFSESGHIAVDAFQKTSVPGIYAAGDNHFQMRSVSHAVFAGSFAGAMINKDLIEDDF